MDGQMMGNADVAKMQALGAMQSAQRLGSTVGQNQLSGPNRTLTDGLNRLVHLLEFGRKIEGDASTFADQLGGSNPQADGKGQQQPMSGGSAAGLHAIVDQYEGLFVRLAGQIERMRAAHG